MKHTFPLAAVVFALAAPALAEMSVGESWTLEELGYTLTSDAPEKTVTLTGPAGESWHLPANPARFSVWTLRPSDHTGDNLPELIVFEQTSRSAGAVHVLTLAPGEVIEIESADMHVLEMSPYMNLLPGQHFDEMFNSPTNPRESEPDMVEEAN